MIQYIYFFILVSYSKDQLSSLHLMFSILFDSHLMDLFISYLTLYIHAKWDLAFTKFSVLSYVKEILVDNKHLSSCHCYEKVSFKIGYAIVFSLAKISLS